VVEGAAGEKDEEKRNDDLILWLGFDLAFGVHGDTSDGVGAGDGGLNVLSVSVRQYDLFEVEAKGTAASEGAGRFGLGDGADDGCALGYGDSAVGIKDGLGDNCVNRLA
jgi:hypothetical protein